MALSTLTVSKCKKGLEETTLHCLGQGELSPQRGLDVGRGPMFTASGGCRWRWKQVAGWSCGNRHSSSLVSRWGWERSRQRCSHRVGCSRGVCCLVGHSSKLMSLKLSPGGGGGALKTSPFGELQRPAWRIGALLGGSLVPRSLSWVAGCEQLVAGMAQGPGGTMACSVYSTHGLHVPVPFPRGGPRGYGP